MIVIEASQIFIWIHQCVMLQWETFKHMDFAYMCCILQLRIPPFLWVYFGY